VLSLDGKKIAFVESGTASSIFHVITWKAGDGTSPTNFAAPGAKMTSLPSCELCTVNPVLFEYELNSGLPG
jgi:hypothetical protein